MFIWGIKNRVLYFESFVVYKCLLANIMCPLLLTSMVIRVWAQEKVTAFHACLLGMRGCVCLFVLYLERGGTEREQC